MSPSSHANAEVTRQVEQSETLQLGSSHQPTFPSTAEWATVGQSPFGHLWAREQSTQGTTSQWEVMRSPPPSWSETRDRHRSDAGAEAATSKWQVDWVDTDVQRQRAVETRESETQVASGMGSARDGRRERAFVGR